MTAFDEYNRQWWSRSYSENVRRFVERANLSEHDVDEMQASARRERDRRYEDCEE